MKTHALGPWEVSPRCGCCAVVDANRKEIVFLDEYPRFFEGKPCGSVTSQGRTREELAATARLISAAPDLLAACIDAMECIRTGGHHGDANRTMEALGAAIAKSGGVA